MHTKEMLPPLIGGMVYETAQVIIIIARITNQVAANCLTLHSEFLHDIINFLNGTFLLTLTNTSSSINHAHAFV